jgi:hypothetical protein
VLKMKTTITKRILKLELGEGLIETEESWRTRELVETIKRRRAARRAREGLPPEEPDEARREDLTGLTIAEVLRRGRARAHAGHLDLTPAREP